MADTGAGTSITFPGIVLHYTCDDTVTTDTSGNNNTGILAGSGTTLSTGLINKKLTFNGSGYITFTSVALFGLASASSEFSVACWVRTTQTDATILSLRNSGNSAIFDFVIGVNAQGGNANTGRLGLSICDDYGSGLVSLTAFTPINDGNWHHVIVTRKSNQQTSLYLDGAQSSNTFDSLTSSLTPSVASSAIGYQVAAGVRPLIGDLDDLQIYSRALTDSEIASIYGGGLGNKALSAALGTFAFTGVTATPEWGRVLSANTGAFVTTRIAAGGLNALKLQAPVATFVVKRNDIALQRTGASAMAANTGVFTFTPTSTGLLSAHAMPAVTGAFALNGVDAAWGGTHIMAAAPGALVFTGLPAAGLHMVARLTMSPGSFVFTGIWVVFDLEHVISGGPPPGEPNPVMPGVLNMGRKVWIRPGRWC